MFVFMAAQFAGGCNNTCCHGYHLNNKGGISGIFYLFIYFYTVLDFINNYLVATMGIKLYIYVALATLANQIAVTAGKAELPPHLGLPDSIPIRGKEFTATLACVLSFSVVVQDLPATTSIPVQTR